jgi:predicted GNAT family N-acyltransferase
MNVIHELNEKHILQLCDLYQLEWWSKGRTLDETRQCVAGSQICIGLVDGNNDLAGFTRVLTDFTFKALIFDVIVRSSERGKGLGDQLISHLKSHQQLQGIKHFELYCMPDMLDFYGRHGFSTDVGEMRLMRQVSAKQ